MSTLPANKLSTEKIGKLIWEYSFPSIVGMVVMSVYNIVDRIFIGHGVGALAISGLALTFPFMILLQAFGMLIGAGAASRILYFQDNFTNERLLTDFCYLPLFDELFEGILDGK